MDWIRGVTRSAVKRTSSATKRPVSPKKTPSATKPARVVFVSGQPKVARPKPSGSGYYYLRKDSNGKIHKVSVVGRTYSRQEAHKKITKRG